MKWLRTFFYYVVAFGGGALAWGLAFYLHKRFDNTMSIEGTQDTFYPIIAVVPILQNALPQTIAAGILRRVAKKFAWAKVWQWLFAGMAISHAIVFIFGRLGLAIETARLPLEWQSLKMSVFFALMGPIMAVSVLPLWVPLLATGSISLILWCIATSCGKQNP